MADVATLDLRARTVDLERARRELRGVVQDGGHAERQTDRFTAATTRSEGAARRQSTASALMAGGLRRVASAAGAVAGAMAAAFSARAIVSEISQFEAASARMGAISRATAGELDLMRGAARRMGAETEFSATQAAEGLTFLAMAGFSARESVSALPAVLNLATASQMDLGRAADITSNIMSAFGVRAEDSAQVADLLAAASSRANTDVAQLGDAMKYVGPVAQAMGIEMSTVAAAVGSLSDAGIQGAMAGTSLRQILSSLTSPTRSARDAIRSLGLEMRDLNPATNDLTDIIDRLAASGLDAAQAMAIAGQRGGPALLALVEQRQNLRRLSEGLRDVDGEATRMAETMRDTLAGDLQTLWSSIQAVILSMGEAGLTAVLRGVVQGLTATARVIGTVVDLLGGLLRVAGMVGSALRDMGVWILRTLVGANRLAETSTDNLTIAIGDEMRQLALLSAAMQDGEYMTLAMIEGKIAEAEARLSNVRALVQERRELELAAAGYQQLLRDMELARGVMRSQREGSEAYEAAERSLVEMLRRQQEILREVDARVTLTNDEREALAQVEARLEDLRGRQQAINGEAETGVGLTNRLTGQTQNWAAAMGAVASNLQGVLSVLSTLSGGMVDQASMRAQMEALRAGRTVADARRVGIETRENIELQGRRQILEGRFGSRFGGMMASALEHETEQRRALALELEAEYEVRSRLESAATRGGGGGGAAASAEEANAVQDVVQALQDEIAAIGMSEQARRVRTELQRAGVELYSEEGQRIADLVEELYALADAQDDVNQRAEQTEQAFETAFVSFVTGTQSARDALASLARDLARMAAQRAFQQLFGGMFGGGGKAGGGLLAGIFGGAPSFAGGGFTGMGARTGGLDGKGGFPAILHPNEVVQDLTKGQGGGSEPVQVVVSLQPSGEFDARVQDNARAVVRVEGPKQIAKAFATARENKAFG